MANRAIVTLTLNPCIDQVAYTPRVEPDRKLRLHDVSDQPGGGGINVSRAIARLGGASTAIHVAGGETGVLLRRLLDEEGIEQQPLEIERSTRRNTNIFETGSEHAYRFLMPGAGLDAAVIERCEQMVGSLDEGAWLVLSGSVPAGEPNDAYARLIATAHARQARVILDASGEALRRALEKGVFLVKPNLHELEALVDRPLETDDSIRDAAARLVQQAWATVVLVSLGGGGALLVSREAAHRLPAPTVPVRSRIGAGDSTVAGLTLALARGRELLDAARFGVAAGAAAVATPGLDLCRREDADRLYHQLTRLMNVTA